MPLAVNEGRYRKPFEGLVIAQCLLLASGARRIDDALKALPGRDCRITTAIGSGLTWPACVMIDRFVRFAAAGAIGTAFHYSILVLIVEAVGASPVVATTWGAIVGATINYALNYRLTFRSKLSHSSTLPKFALIAIAGTVLNSVVVYLLVLRGAHYLLSQVAATALVLALGFLANQFWAFAEKSIDDSTGA